MKKILIGLVICFVAVVCTSLVVLIVDYFDEPVRWDEIAEIIADDGLENQLGAPAFFSISSSGMEKYENREIFQRVWIQRHLLSEHRLNVTVNHTDGCVDYRILYKLKDRLGGIGFEVAEGSIRLSDIRYPIDEEVAR